jgi:hypothetical protein
MRPYRRTTVSEQRRSTKPSSQPASNAITDVALFHVALPLRVTRRVVACWPAALSQTLTFPLVPALALCHLVTITNSQYSIFNIQYSIFKYSILNRD